MIQYNVFPGGRKRVLTLSYDDGHINDVRLVELFNRYGVKATFHLNGHNYIDMTDEQLKEIRDRYAGHEISCHTLQHGFTSQMPRQSMVTEILEDRKILEKIAGYPVVGMSYPYGAYNEDMIRAADACGIVYSRTVKSTKTFVLPDNFLTWNPTCHHRDALGLCDSFMMNDGRDWKRSLFYIWGHSFEMRTEADWNAMEEILMRVANNESVWYATNIEIYDYMTAQRSLKISVDETVFYNPANISVWVEKDKKDIICVPAGETVCL